MKYQISYTLKDEEKFSGFHRELFKTKKASNEWLKNNKSRLYWHQFTEISPKSKLPRPLLLDEPGDNYTLKIGKLQTHFETGMECLGLVFYEDGIHGPPNPDFDPSKPEDRSNFKNFASYDGLTFINSGHVLQIEDGPKIFMMKDHDFAKRDGYRLSFYPRGFSKKELLEIFGKENVKAKLWIRKKEDIKI